MQSDIPADDTNGVSESADAVAASGDETAEPQHLGAVYEAMLRLIEARSLYLVGMALAVRCPTEDEFTEFLSSPEFTEAIDAFASVRRDILLDGATKQAETSLEDAITEHSARARESLEVLAALLKIAPEDIVSVLIR